MNKEPEIIPCPSDPGPEHRFIDPHKDSPQSGDEYWNVHEGCWKPRVGVITPYVDWTTYRRKELRDVKAEIEQFYQANKAEMEEGLELPPPKVQSVTVKAKTDKVSTGLILIPWYSILEIGKIFIEGLRYGRDNWKKGAGDKEYQEERLEHAMLHLLKYKEGDRTEAHLAKVAWFCVTQLELERIENEQAKTIKAGKFTPDR